MRLDKVSCVISILTVVMLEFPPFFLFHLAGPQPQIPVSAKNKLVQGGWVRLSALLLGLLRASAALWGRLPLSLPEASVPGFW